MAILYVAHAFGKRLRPVSPPAPKETARYPRNLKGDAILIEARIIAVADVVESMASHRPYRPALGLDAALEELEKNRGTLYDEAIVDACLRLFREKGYRFAEG